MRILIIGEEQQLSECRIKFGDRHQYASSLKVEHLGDQDVVFDFVPDKDHFIEYSRFPHLTVFADASRHAASEWIGVSDNDIFGFAGLPTFINRPVLEVSSPRVGTETKIETICEQLGTPYEVVKDVVGLVTPRVICMIINEAYCTYEEGIASREDIDRAMILGTAYPYGPFDWSNRIGLKNVFEVLTAMARHGDPACYRVSQLLTKEC